MQADHVALGIVHQSALAIFADRKFRLEHLAAGLFDPALLDSRTVQDFEKDNKTRTATAKKFADERAAYEKAKDLEIAAARKAGDETSAKRLRAEKKSFVDQQLKNEASALKGFDAATNANRVAQVKDLYDQQLDLVRDNLGREAKANEDAFSQGLRDLASYLAQRKTIQQQQTDADVADLEQRLQRTRAVLETNTKRASAPGLDANAKETFQEAVASGTEAVAKLEAEITKKKRDQVDAARELADLQGKLNRELRDTLADVERQTKQANGTETLGDIQARVQDQFKGLRERVFQLGGDIGLVDALVGTTTRKEAFRKLQEDYGTLADQLRNQEQAISQAAEQGASTTEDAERRKFDARAAALPQLQELGRQLQALASTPQEKNAVAQVVLQLDELADKTTSVTRTLRGTVGSGFSEFFTDVVTGAERADRAFGKFIAGIAKAALNIIGQRLGEQLANSLFPKGGGSGGGFLGSIGDFLGSFFHTGGVVGSTMRTMTRVVSPHVFAGAQVLHGGGIVGSEQAGFRSLPPMAFAGAPRYHSGGIAGDEVPAILRKGEGVFTPGQMAALGGSGGGDSVTIHQTVSISVGVAQTVRAEVLNMLPQIQAASRAAVMDARLRGGSTRAAFRG